jgi:hypothetical protein
VHRTKEPEHKDEFDEWLACIICFAFRRDPEKACPGLNLNLHTYENRPDPTTGAVLPASAAGYIAFDVPGIGTGRRGAGRLVVDIGSGAIYYTRNHYLSFYPLRLNPAGSRP